MKIFPQYKAIVRTLSTPFLEFDRENYLYLKGKWTVQLCFNFQFALEVSCFYATNLKNKSLYMLCFNVLLIIVSFILFKFSFKHSFLLLIYSFFSIFFSFLLHARLFVSFMDCSVSKPIQPTPLLEPLYLRI